MKELYSAGGPQASVLENGSSVKSTSGAKSPQFLADSAEAAPFTGSRVSSGFLAVSETVLLPETVVEAGIIESPDAL
jgi:hypothetical protein